MRDICSPCAQLSKKTLRSERGNVRCTVSRGVVTGQGMAHCYGRSSNVIGTFSGIYREERRTLTPSSNDELAITGHRNATQLRLLLVWKYFDCSAAFDHSAWAKMRPGNRRHSRGRSGAFLFTRNLFLKFTENYFDIKWKIKAKEKPQSIHNDSQWSVVLNARKQ